MKKFKRFRIIKKGNEYIPEHRVLGFLWYVPYTHEECIDAKGGVFVDFAYSFKSAFEASAFIYEQVFKRKPECVAEFNKDELMNTNFCKK